MSEQQGHRFWQVTEVEQAIARLDAASFSPETWDALVRQLLWVIGIQEAEIRGSQADVVRARLQDDIAVAHEAIARDREKFVRERLAFRRRRELWNARAEKRDRAWRALVGRVV